jgi:hypothetical protein
MTDLFRINFVFCIRPQDLSKEMRRYVALESRLIYFLFILEKIIFERKTAAKKNACGPWKVG